MRVEVSGSYPSIEQYQVPEAAGEPDALVIDSSKNPSLFNVVKEGLQGLLRPINGKIRATAALAVLSIATVIAVGDASEAHAGDLRSAPLGDVDCNSAVNGVDSLLILQGEVGLAQPRCGFAGDVDDSGLSDALDALQILHFNAGIIDQLPAQLTQNGVKCGEDKLGPWCIQLPR